MQFRPFPEAFILGAMRSGTTFLHSLLLQHPDVAKAEEKELQFFSLHWDQGLKYYRRQMPRRGSRWIYALAGRSRPLVVDASPYYLFHPDVPWRLHKTIGPEAKCIVLMREPGARAWSHYQMHLSLGWEHLGFRDALAAEPERIRQTKPLDPSRGLESPFQLFSYVARGFYASQLQAWWRCIPREQFLLLRSEDLYREPQTILDLVCDFLNLHRIMCPKQSSRNAGRRVVLPSDMREYLDCVFEEPNQVLRQITGIGWEQDGCQRSLPFQEAACL